ncbi:dihydroxyacetone kinase subunit DhaL [Aureimonas sp. AU12]|uniref:dihydroxyacetone kinase subunit DhaL n=1 Tax=Aureimonas sp. AU12 TaxID=1638161 RepID=UPI000783ED62|nr:dihydroxyacetone kinase subunit DhaL [Aureimonas sp. AU12]
MTTPASTTQGASDGHPGEALVRMFALASAAIEAERDALCDLDGAIGDADHGTTMALGLRAVVTALGPPGRDAIAPSEVFRTAAAAFLDAVGASTGPLYATGFRRAAQRLDGADAFGLAEQAQMLAAIAAGIAERGKGGRGDKTMLDAWLPARDAAEVALVRGDAPVAFWNGVVAAGGEGAEATRSMVASRGRAARLGERSLGHLDPGAVSAVLILKAMAAVFGPAG